MNATAPSGGAGWGRVDVVVTVGTDHHPFARLVDWADRWARANPDLVVLVQHGTTPAPVYARSTEMVGYDELIAAMAGARAVVTQGGPATIMDARSVGHRPIVVPRRGSAGEHVDDHQVRFAAWMAERDLIHLAADQDSLAALLDRAADDPDALRIPPDDGQVDATIETFGRLVDPLVEGARARRVRRRR